MVEFQVNVFLFVLKNFNYEVCHFSEIIEAFFKKKSMWFGGLLGDINVPKEISAT